MPDVLGELISHGSIYLIVGALIVAGLGLPLPEDIALLAAGVLVHQGQVSYLEALVWCAIGVFFGDTTIFLLARRLGPAAYEKAPLKWLLTPQRREKVEDLFARYGNVIVFMGRHMAGLRAPIFAMAGINHVPISRFWLWDGLGLCVSAPVVIGIGWWLADNLDEAKRLLGRFEFVVIAVLLSAIVAFFLWRRMRRASSLQEH
jgi:membrane protein DedA with SNARE-associated domain